VLIVEAGVIHLVHSVSVSVRRDCALCYLDQTRRCLYLLYRDCGLCYLDQTLSVSVVSRLRTVLSGPDVVSICCFEIADWVILTRRCLYLLYWYCGLCYLDQTSSVSVVSRLRTVLSRPDVVCICCIDIADWVILTRRCLYLLYRYCGLCYLDQTLFVTVVSTLRTVLSRPDVVCICCIETVDWVI